MKVATKVAMKLKRKNCCATRIEFVFNACSFLPLLGLLTWFLPEVGRNTRIDKVIDEVGD